MIAFWLLAPLMVLCAIGILFARKAVHCALLLAVVMISLAVLYVVQDAPFLFAVQIIVYTGAILMLFLFVLMLVGVDASDSVVETIPGQRIFAAVVGGLFAITLTVAVSQVTFTVTGLGPANSRGNVPAIAQILFTRYVFAFELASALLITAALGAMVLAHRERLTPKVTQADLARQRVRDFADNGRHLGPLPPPGTFARHNAVDTPALLPDGTAAPGSVSRVLLARGAAKQAPVHDIDVIVSETGPVDDSLAGHPRRVSAADPDPDRATLIDGDAAVDPDAAADDDVREAEQEQAEVLPDAWPGSARSLPDRSMPPGHPVKANKQSMLYHLPEGRWYDVTIAELWFESAESAEAAGFTKAGTRKKKGDQS